MNRVASNADHALSNDGISRRRVLFGATALAASALSPASWAQASSNWPLWEVEGPHGKVYLTGETPARAVAWKDARIEALVTRCSALWTETNQVQHADPKEWIRRYGVDTSTPLLSKLSKADQARVAKVAEMAGTPVDSLAAFRPWLAAFALEQGYYGAKGYAESGTIEKVLLPKAQDAGVALASEFATQADVFTFMGAMSPAEDVQYLQYTLDHILDGTAANERVYSAWSRGDTSGAEAMALRMRDDQPDLYRKHVIGRNKGWVPRIQAMLDAPKPALVVVGLYHLAGPDSVRAQLEAQGLAVRAI